MIRRSTALLAFALICLTSHARPVNAEPVKCSRAISKELAKYVSATSKIVDKCKKGVITKGAPSALAQCPDAASAAKIAAAAAKLRASIGKACGGADKTCNGAGDDDLAAIHWNVPQCMGFEGQCGGIAINGCAAVANCLVCVGDLAVEQAVDGLLYDPFNGSAFFPNNKAAPGKAVNKCQATIAAVGAKFLQAKTGILAKCWDAKLAGKDGFAGAVRCPDTDPKAGSGKPPATAGDNKTVEAVKKAEQKKVAAICKACGAGGDANKDGQCDVPPGFALADVVDLPFACPAVTVPPNAVDPSGRDCGAITVTALQSYVDCIDCVLEFKADCLSDAAVGDDAPALGIDYPAECVAAPPTPTATAVVTTATRTPTPSVTATATRTATPTLTATRTATASPTPTLTSALTATPSRTATPTVTLTATRTPTPTLTSTRTATPTPTRTATPTVNGPTATPTGPMPTSCPVSYSFTGGGPSSDVDRGWTGTEHDEHLPSMSELTLAVSGCAGGGAPCGQCTVSGPVVNAGGAATANRRCRGTTSGANGSWIQCTSDADCTGSGNACVFFFGAPQPSAAGGVAFCYTNEIASGVTGTVNADTGAAAFTLTLRTNGYFGGSLGEPCPQCVSGTCDSGARSGMACTVNGSGAVFGAALSLDCPATGGPFTIASSTVPLSTGTQTMVLGAGDPACTSGTFSNKKCFCNASQPNNCSDGVCTPNAADTDSADEGSCLAGPFESHCVIQTFQPCFSNGDCPVPGDSCGPSMARQCFTTNGNVGDDVTAAGLASTIAPTLAGLYCLPATGSSIVNAAAGFPGLARMTIPGTASFGF